jgi:hypothetical protein
MVETNRPLSELVEALPSDLQASVRDFVEFLLSKREQTAGMSEETEVHSLFPADPRRSIMLREAEAYRQMHPELVDRYMGQYVAIFQGRMVDHDQDAEALSERIRVRLPDQVVLQRRVETIPEVILHFRSPRFVSTL